MSWSSATLSTTASIAEIEREINSLIESSGSEYFSHATEINIASANSGSVDCSDGMIEIVGKVNAEITIKDGKSLSFSIQHSQDDNTFADIYPGDIIYKKSASGSDIVIAADTELFRYVVPTNVYDFIRFTLASDTTNSGKIDIYSIGKWEPKIARAKSTIKNKLETLLVDRGYRDYANYADGEELIDIIGNPATFALASDYLTLYYIFSDLATREDIESMYYAKKNDYLREFNGEYTEAIRRIDWDYNMDATIDEYKANVTPKILL